MLPSTAITVSSAVLKLVDASSCPLAEKASADGPEAVVVKGEPLTWVIAPEESSYAYTWRSAPLPLSSLVARKSEDVEGSNASPARCPIAELLADPSGIRPLPAYPNTSTFCEPPIAAPTKLLSGDHETWLTGRLPIDASVWESIANV